MTASPQDSAANETPTDSTRTSAEETEDAPAQATSPRRPATSPPTPTAGIAGGVPGAAALTSTNQHALAAVAAAEAEVGGMAYYLRRQDDAWVVRIRVWNGGREVTISPDGQTVHDDGTIVEGPDMEVLDGQVVQLGEAVELAVAHHPGDLRSLELGGQEPGSPWLATISGDGAEHQVQVDSSTAEVSDG